MFMSMITNITSNGNGVKLTMLVISHRIDTLCLQVLVASGVDLKVGDMIELDAVFLPQGSVLVARMNNPTAKKFLL